MVPQHYLCTVGLATATLFAVCRILEWAFQSQLRKSVDKQNPTGGCPLQKNAMQGAQPPTRSHVYWCSNTSFCRGSHLMLQGHIRGPAEGQQSSMQKVTADMHPHRPFKHTHRITEKLVSNLHQDICTQVLLKGASWPHTAQVWVGS